MDGIRQRVPVDRAEMRSIADISGGQAGLEQQRNGQWR
jgi:hypothetical protein